MLKKSILCLILLSLLVGCDSNTRYAKKFNPYQNLGELSEVTWYLEKKYNMNYDDFYQCNFYDFDDNQEAFYVVVELPSKNKELGKFLLFAYDRDFDDDGFKMYDNMPFSETNRVKIGRDLNKKDCYRIDLDDSDSTSIYIAVSQVYDESRINRISISHKCIEYNTINNEPERTYEYASESNEQKEFLQVNYTDTFELSDFKYQFDKNNNVIKVYEYSEDKDDLESKNIIKKDNHYYGLLYECTYKNNVRTSIKDIDNNKIIFDRDNANRIASMQYENNKMIFNYKDDGNVIMSKQEE